MSNSNETHLLVVHGGQQNCVVRNSDTFQINLETLLILGREGSWDLVCSIDGLVLLKRIRDGPDGPPRVRDLKVWNPSIGKFHELPSLPEIETSPYRIIQDAEIGIGYELLANDYKHVKVIFEDKILQSVAVYSLGTGCWKIIPFQGKGCSWHWDRRSIKCGRKVYFWGSLYFLDRDAHNHRDCELVSFDLSCEVFSSINLPDDHYLSDLSELMLIDGGCSVAVFDTSLSQIPVWVLESSRDESESMCWTKRYSLRPEYVDRFLYIKKNGDILAWAHHYQTLTTETDE